MEAGRLPLRDRAGLPLGAGVQTQRIRPVSVEIPRRGCCPARRIEEVNQEHGRRLLRFAAASATVLFALSCSAVAADLNKVLRVVFVAPENGFDPQATGD